MQSSIFVLSISVGEEIKFRASNRKLSREEFYEWLWAECGARGLLGVHEGSLLTEEAFEKGIVSESLVIDSAQAPIDRDWVSRQVEVQAELYFESLLVTNEMSERMSSLDGVRVGEIREQHSEDWNAKWRDSFLEQGEFSIPPFWKISPAWVETGNQAQLTISKALNEETRSEVVLKINPGGGFGTGTHETTQLCLTALGDLINAFVTIGKITLQFPNSSQYKYETFLQGWKTLDFGCGSGILGIGAALLGSEVDAVEIDSLAIENAKENAVINGVDSKIHFFENLSQLDCKYSDPAVYERTPVLDVPKTFPRDLYQCIFANILRPVLLEFSSQLVKRLAPGGSLILSGLLEKDVPILLNHEHFLIPNAQIEVRSLGDWRAIVMSKALPPAL